ncbi:MAG: DUF2188 domain-containing protein [Candidatus Methanoplasma sp.]|jgi:hypothetical protein|nr:DUF2188 domain-containing protein [Candidatus Methanoplasma sp.]
MGFFDKLKGKKGENDKAPKKEAEIKEKDAGWAASREKPAEDAPKAAAKEQKPKEHKPKEQGPKEEKAENEEKKSDGKVWHITKRDDGMWQVKARGAKRATKLFKTKAEAEAYVKTLVSNNDGSRVVKHKKTGEFQKK